MWGLKRAKSDALNSELTCFLLQLLIAVVFCAGRSDRRSYGFIGEFFTFFIVCIAYVTNVVLQMLIKYQNWTIFRHKLLSSRGIRLGLRWG